MCTRARVIARNTAWMRCPNKIDLPPPKKYSVDEVLANCPGTHDANFFFGVTVAPIARAIVALQVFNGSTCPLPYFVHASSLNELLNYPIVYEIIFI